MNRWIQALFDTNGFVVAASRSFFFVSCSFHYQINELILSYRFRNPSYTKYYTQTHHGTWKPNYRGDCHWLSIRPAMFCAINLTFEILEWANWTASMRANFNFEQKSAIANYKFCISIPLVLSYMIRRTNIEHKTSQLFSDDFRCVRPSVDRHTRRYFALRCGFPWILRWTQNNSERSCFNFIPLLSSQKKLHLQKSTVHI